MHGVFPVISYVANQTTQVPNKLRLTATQLCVILSADALPAAKNLLQLDRDASLRKERSVHIVPMSFGSMTRLSITFDRSLCGKYSPAIHVKY